MYKDIKVAGVGRSGTTLISHILKQIVSHEQDPAIFQRWANHGIVGGRVIIAYRDFRDILVSRWKIAHSLQGHYDSYLTQQMTKDEIITEIKTMNIQMKAVDSIIDNRSNILIFLQYEKFYKNFDYVFNELEPFLEYTFSDTLKDTIIKTCSLPTMIAKMKQNKDFTTWTDDHVHGHHISHERGESTWKTYIPEELHNYVNEQLNEQLKKWNYK